MTDRSPLVSVIITTHYRNEGLRRAIDHALAQTYRPIELIVVDDSGERFAEAVVAAYEGVRYIAHETNEGAVQARQTGVDAAAGAYIQFHDDDDWLAPPKLERQVARLKEQPGVGVVYCGLKQDDGVVKLPDPELRGDVLRAALALYELYPYQTTTSLFRATLLDDILPIPQYAGGGDWVLAIEAAQRTAFDFVDEVLVNRSVIERSKGTSLATRTAQIDIVRAYSDLYAEYPGLRRKTLAEAYWKLGHAYLNEQRWSADAIGSFLKANYLATSVKPKYLLSLGCSLFGRWGRDVGRSKVQGLLRYLRATN